MRTYQIMSETRDGALVAVCYNDASSANEARENTARFCQMMGITVHSVTLAPAKPATKEN